MIKIVLSAGVLASLTVIVVNICCFLPQCTYRSFLAIDLAQAKVEHLKECKPSAWWNEVKKLSGCSPAFTERSYVTKSLQHLYGPSDDATLANIINKAFLSPMRSFTPLPADYVIHPTNPAPRMR